MGKLARPGAPPLPDHLRLSARESLPDDLLYLTRQHPRDTWESGAATAQVAQAWLHFHEQFRRAGGAISAQINALREGHVKPGDFSPRFASLASRFISGLEGHHGVEDDYYFPTFMKAEPGLARGFEILDSDHDAVHGGLERFANASAELLRALAADQEALGSDQRFALDRLAQDWTAFRKHLLRHLDDEEDIVIPLMIELARRGAGAA